MSILPIYTGLVLGLCFVLVVRAQGRVGLSTFETMAAYGLMACFLAWTAVAVALGQRGLHVTWMERIPLLWQAMVPMAIWMTGVALSPALRRTLRKVARATPAHWLALVQALRIGAIGGVMKGISGEIQSSYVFWIGVPDFLFGVSALVVAWMAWRGAIPARALAYWNLVGVAVIVLPTFLPMLYWMSEPGFEFIFAFPMVLAPSIVVSILVSLNLLQAWIGWRQAPVVPSVS